MADKRDDDNLWGHLWREALVAMSLGWELALPIFAGALLGHFLDRWLGTGLNFTLGLMMLGVVVAYYSLARFIRRIDRRDAQAANRKKEAKDEAADEPRE